MSAGSAFPYRWNEQFYIFPSAWIAMSNTGHYEYLFAFFRHVAAYKMTLHAGCARIYPIQSPWEPICDSRNRPANGDLFRHVTGSAHVREYSQETYPRCPEVILVQNISARRRYHFFAHPLRNHELPCAPYSTHMYVRTGFREKTKCAHAVHK